MTFFSKARVLTLGNLHELLDKTIDLNSPAVLNQYVRDLETAMTKLKSEAVVAAAATRTTNREMGDLQHNIETKTISIKSRLNSPNVTVQDTIVRSWAAQVTSWQSEVAQKQSDLLTQQKDAQSLDAAIAKLEVKHNAMVSNVRKLQSAVKTTAAKNTAADALEQAGKLSSGADGVSIDNLQANIRAKADVADEKFDRAMNSDAYAETADESASVDSFLAGLK